MLRWSASLRHGVPQRHRDHAAVAVGPDVYSFGGNSKVGAIGADRLEVHVFNTVSLRWTTLFPPEDGGGGGGGQRPGPGRRWCHTAVLVGHVAYIWGGRSWSAQSHPDALHAFDVDARAWFEPQVSGTVPEGREHHSACCCTSESGKGSVMYVHGGWTELQKFDDVHKLDTATMVWSLIGGGGAGAHQPAPPPASSSHFATMVGTKMFVFGGRGGRADQSNYKNTTRVFDTETERWLSTPSPSPSQPLPEPRAGHCAFTYNGELYIFGGHNRVLKQAFNDLWKFNPETFSWRKVEPKGGEGEGEGLGPSPGTTPICCCVVGDRAVLFGGYTMASIDRETGEPLEHHLYVLDLSSTLKTLCKLAVVHYGLERTELPHDVRMSVWTVTVKGPKRKPGHVAVAVGHKVFLFGGDSDVHVFDTVSLRWTHLPPAEGGGGGARRAGYTAALIEGVVYIWGGPNGHVYDNVIDAFDVDRQTWFQPEVSGTVPACRCFHSCCVLGAAMFIYGGVIISGNNDRMYKLVTTTMVWSSINAPATLLTLHSATVIGTKMLVFGGMEALPRHERLHALDDTVRVFDTETDLWLSAPSPPHPTGMLFCHSAFAYNGELYICGGVAMGTPPHVINDLWKFNLDAVSWKKAEPKGRGPSIMCMMCCCMVGDHVVIYGGLNGARSDDNLYILDLGPSLKTLCKVTVIQYGLDQSELPHNIRWELAAMTIDGY